jgi:ankyrin repeat protein
MAARNGFITDLDAFFEQENAEPNVKQKLNTFFESTDPDFFKNENGTTRYGYHFKHLLYSNDLDSFDEFMNTFNVSPNATYTLEIKDPIRRRYDTITAPLFCFVTGIGGVFNKEFAEYLLEKGANIYEGFTNPDLDTTLTLNPLMSAAYYGSIDAIKYLLENTELRSGDKMWGTTARQWAERRRIKLEREMDRLEDAMHDANGRGERNHIQSILEDLQWLSRDYDDVVRYLRSVTPQDPVFENRNFQVQLRPNLKTAIEALSVKGVPRKNNKTQKLRIPRNVMGHLAQMLPPRRRGFLVNPVNTGLKHVQTNLFTNSPASVAVNQNAINEPTNLGRIKSNLLRSTRRIKKTRKARKARKSRRS